MLASRREREERILKKLNESKNFSLFVDAMNYILFLNNDMLEEPINKDYLNYLRTTRAYLKEKWKSNPIIFMSYQNIISKITNFINEIASDEDIITKYALLLKMINGGYISGKTLTRINSKYLDCYHYYGLDAILGNSCCRHQVSLLHDVLKNITDTRRICIGNYENKKATHCILAAYDDELEKYLLLDPTGIEIYNPNDNLVLSDSKSKKKYIKANYSVSYYPDFNDMNSFLKFFKELYSSNLEEEEYEEILNRARLAYSILSSLHESDFVDFSNYIKPYREKIVRLLKR